MREFIPSDYIDKEGNVYETVGENIREGKNGAFTSDFPTPEDIGNGLVGSDGTNYIPILKNLGTVSFKNRYAIVDIKSSGLMSWIATNVSINSNTMNTDIPIGTRGVVEYLRLKIPNAEENYSWITVNVTYDGTNYSIDNPLFKISKDGTITSDKNVVDLFPISTTDTPGKIIAIEKGFSATAKSIIGWNIKCSYTAKLLVEG